MHCVAVSLVKGRISRKAPFSFGTYQVESFLADGSSDKRARAAFVLIDAKPLGIGHPVPRDQSARKE